jgi:hypothetical protein
MTFLAPAFLYAALTVAVAIVGLHLIVTRQPRESVLPTARFVPDTRATAIAASRRPTDLLLMFIRMLIVLAAGAGMAKPVLTPSRAPSARVILADVSRSARDSIATRDSVRSYYRDGDAVVLFDSSTRFLAGNVADSIGALRPSIKHGNLSAALIAGLRAGSSLRDRADSLELVIVSPFAKEELDAATDTIRTLWRGRARLVRIPIPAADTVTVPGRLAITSGESDPLHVSVELARKTTKVSALVDRRTARSQSVVSNPGGVLIDWPASTRPRFAIPRAVPDTVGGVMAFESVVVAAFDRHWSFPQDSLNGAEVIARWVDGDPAAVEKPDGTGCTRSVAIPVTPVGDLVIRHEFVRMVGALSRPCASKTSLILADPAAVAKLEGQGRLAPRSAFQPVTDRRSELAPWLFALALAAAIGELLVRRRGRGASVTDSENRTDSSEARAA